MLIRITQSLTTKVLLRSAESTVCSIVSTYLVRAKQQDGRNNTIIKRLIVRLYTLLQTLDHPPIIPQRPRPEFFITQVIIRS